MGLPGPGEPRMALDCFSTSAIARIAGVSRMTVTKWKQQMKHRRHGLTGLKNLPRSGRPSAADSPTMATGATYPYGKSA
jgi:transposase